MIKTEYYGRFKRYRPVALRWTNIFMAKFILRMNLIKILVFLWKGGSKQTKYGISPDQGSIFHGDHGLYP